MKEFEILDKEQFSKEQCFIERLKLNMTVKQDIRFMRITEKGNRDQIIGVFVRHTDQKNTERKGVLFIFQDSTRRQHLLAKEIIKGLIPKVLETIVVFEDDYKPESVISMAKYTNNLIEDS